jgi:hypothetical protein
MGDGHYLLGTVCRPGRASCAASQVAGPRLLTEALVKLSGILFTQDTLAQDLERLGTHCRRCDPADLGAQSVDVGRWRSANGRND